VFCRYPIRKIGVIKHKKIHRSDKLTMNGIVLEHVNQIFRIVKVVDGGDSKLLGVVYSCSKEETSNSSKSVDT